MVLRGQLGYGTWPQSYMIFIAGRQPRICCAEFVLAKAIDVLGVALAIPTGSWAKLCLDRSKKYVAIMRCFGLF